MTSLDDRAADSPGRLGGWAFPLRLSKAAAFHILNISGWMGFLLVDAYIARSVKLSSASQVIWAVCFFACGALICLGIRLVYRKRNYRARPLGSLAVVVVITSVVAAAIWYLTEIGTCAVTAPETLNPDHLAIFFGPARVANRLLSYSWPFMMWSILYLGINLWMDWRCEQARAREAALLAQKAQLQMLRYQLNPHFLFNALNSIRALVDENSEGARGMVTELAEFLRYSLVNRESKDVPLKIEMEAIGHYLSIQKRRYEENLAVSAAISEEAGRYPVPCFLIHPLVENAIKYGMETSTMPLRVMIKAEAVDGNLRVSVSNTGSWIAPDVPGGNHGSGTGTGLQNVRRRLAVAFPESHRFTTKEVGGRVVVEIEIFAGGRRATDEH